MRTAPRFAAAAADAAQELLAASRFVGIDVPRADGAGCANEVPAIAERSDRARRLADECTRIPRKMRRAVAQFRFARRCVCLRLAGGGFFLRSGCCGGAGGGRFGCRHARRVRLLLSSREMPKSHPKTMCNVLGFRKAVMAFCAFEEHSHFPPCHTAKNAREDHTFFVCHRRPQKSLAHICMPDSTPARVAPLGNTV